MPEKALKYLYLLDLGLKLSSLLSSFFPDKMRKHPEGNFPYCVKIKLTRGVPDNQTCAFIIFPKNLDCASLFDTVRLLNLDFQNKYL